MTMARETAAEREAREAQEAADAAVTQATVGSDTDPGEGTKVRVPDSAGPEITFTRGGDVVASFKVNDGIVTARDEHERVLLLDNVAGAELVDA